MSAAIPPRASRKRVAGQHHLGHSRPTPIGEHHHRPVERVVYVERRTFNVDGVIALVFSMLWLFGIGSLVGLFGGLHAVRRGQREGMSGEWVAHIAWISGLIGTLTTIAWILAAVS